MSDAAEERGGAKKHAPASIERELRDVALEHEQRRRQLPRAILTGFIAGMVAVAFRGALGVADHLRTRLIETSWDFGIAGMMLPIVVSAVGVAISLVLVKRIAPETAGSGIPHLKAVLDDLKSLDWRRVLPVKFLGGVAGIGSGLALGREGPTVQMGGAVGQMVSGWFRCSARERQTLISAGAGAGLSAAFNAPLAGLVFVLEEVQRDFSRHVFASTLAASVTADVVSRLLLGQLPVFHVHPHPIPPLASLPVALTIGVAAGFLGVAFNRGLLASMDLFDRISTWPRWAVGLLVGLLIGAVGWGAPGVVAGGHGLVESLLGGGLGIDAIAGLFALRFVMTLVSYGCGAPGGIFAPLLVLGATLGFGIADLAHGLWPAQTGAATTFAVVGMAAYFAAVVRAPLTGIVLIVEMTGDYALVLPLLLASAAAYGIAEYMRDQPIYEALLERDLRRSRQFEERPRPLLIELTVESGAPYAGRRLRDLGLPAGYVLVSVLRGRDLIVPTGDSELAPGDRVTMVVAPDAMAELPAVRRGIGGP